MADSVYDILPTDQYLFVDTSGGPVVLDLPDPTQFPTPKAFIVIDTAGFFSTNNCVLQTFAGELIEGVAASKPLQTAWGAFTVVTDGVNWFVY